MDNETELGAAGRQYAAAHAAHYVARDLPLALELYKTILTSHPGTEEVAYARTQVQNIVNAVVPQQKLLEAQMELAVAHFADTALSDGIDPRSSPSG